MTSHLHRRREAIKRARENAPTIPPWGELVKLENEQLQSLAGRLGIAWTSRMDTLSAINKARG